jgi:hypothetical protein
MAGRADFIFLSGKNASLALRVINFTSTPSSQPLYSQMKLNFVKSDQRLLKWTQIEHKEGKMYMRMKQRGHLLDDVTYWARKGIDLAEFR